MEEKKLRQLFKNRADAYLNTIDESVEQGMSEDCFIKAVNEVFSLPVVSNNEERVAVGCGSCKYKQLEMCDEPCLSCIGYYSKWEQSTD